MKALLAIASVAIGLFFGIFSGNAQRKNGTNTNVSVDKNGVLRWPNGSEVQGFGVNYTAPFAYSFRAANKLGLNIEQIIDADVYHFARLGFDAYRVHVWDTEISDTLGGLLNNEQLRLFDYLVKQLKTRGIKMLLTPIAFWGNGWPEPDTWSPGFAHKYGKDKCLTNPDAILAQKRYLTEFLDHVNPYTGLAYKNDPDVVGFEVSNEPHHGEAPALVTQYIKTMLQGMRSTGCTKPIFYNISHSIHLVDAYYEAGIDGGTFQWYPTGLGFQKEIEGNLLPHVDDYQIPFANHAGFKKGAKIVYEFDAADVNKSYIYPAMALSFRTAGIQWATHFAYEPSFSAPFNTEYNTHYMNLAYTPGKAIGLMIAGEVFHQVPLYKSYGQFPQNTHFDNFKVDYASNLAEMISPEKFYYSNSTQSIPASTNSLKHIAGVGQSSLVQFSGSGAYFLDKISDGIWRLEVMPDAIALQDPFGKNSLGKQLTAIQWRTQQMQINLQNLGSDFSVKTLNGGNSFQAAVNGKSFQIKPGVYLCIQKGKSLPAQLPQSINNLGLNEFFAPANNLIKEQLLHEPAKEASAGNPLQITATIAAEHQPEKVFVTYRKGRQWAQVVLESTNSFGYQGKIPATDLRAGWFDYWLVTENGGVAISYPGAVANKPGNWDFDETKPYRAKILPDSAALTLFNAATDADKVSRPWSRQSNLLPLPEPNRAEMLVRVEKLFTVDNENPNAAPVSDYTMRYFFADKIAHRKTALTNKGRIVMRCRSLESSTETILVALIDKWGRAFGATFKPGMEKQNYSLALGEFKPVPIVIQPRPYPGFLPYFFKANNHDIPFNLAEIESLQISVGPGLSAAALQQKHGLAIESIWLE